MDGSTLELGLDVAPDGAARQIDPPPQAALGRTAWGIKRDTRCDAGSKPRQTMAMLEAPFYSRSVVETVIEGETVTGVHEALDLTRFKSPLIKPMLALRVPRRANWP
jgi:carotenoid 1,2-hydratase